MTSKSTTHNIKWFVHFMPFILVSGLYIYAYPKIGIKQCLAYNYEVLLLLLLLTSASVISRLYVLGSVDLNKEPWLKGKKGQSFIAKFLQERFDVFFAILSIFLVSYALLYFFRIADLNVMANGLPNHLPKNSEPFLLNPWLVLILLGAFLILFLTETFLIRIENNIYQYSNAQSRMHHFNETH